MSAISAQRLIEPLPFLKRRNLLACPQDVKESAYKELVRPVLEYGSSVRVRLRHMNKFCSFTIL